MSYRSFKDKVKGVLSRSGDSIRVTFSSHDGNHYARFSDGTVISGNRVNKTVSVRWNGGNHTAMAVI